MVALESAPLLALDGAHGGQTHLPHCLASALTTCGPASVQGSPHQLVQWAQGGLTSSKNLFSLKTNNVQVTFFSSFKTQNSLDNNDENHLAQKTLEVFISKQAVLPNQNMPQMAPRSNQTLSFSMC